jgi:hypothetical protein
MPDPAADVDHAAAVELLHRQLMEFEVLCAMYPDDDEGASQQRCEMVSDPAAVEAMRAAVEAWESTGVGVHQLSTSGVPLRHVIESAWFHSTI